MGKTWNCPWRLHGKYSIKFSCHVEKTCKLHGDSVGFNGVHRVSMKSHEVSTENFTCFTPWNSMGYKTGTAFLQDRRMTDYIGLRAGASSGWSQLAVRFRPYIPSAWQPYNDACRRSLSRSRMSATGTHSASASVSGVQVDLLVDQWLQQQRWCKQQDQLTYWDSTEIWEMFLILNNP